MNAEHIRHYIDILHIDEIVGWCYDETNLSSQIVLELYIDGKKIGQTTANRYRKDVQEHTSHPSGFAGFIFELSNILITPYNNLFIKIKNQNIYLNTQYAFENFQKEFQIPDLSKDNFQKKDLCIVHAGLHKTGTSSIQHFLSKTKSINFSYFNLFRPNHSFAIYSMFSKNRDTYHFHSNANRTTNDIVEFNNNMDTLFKIHLQKNPKHNTFVISAEDISVLDKESLEQFKTYLDNYFNNIKIVIYIRAPYSYMNSAIQEIIKKPTQQDFYQIINSNYPNYRKKIEKFDLLFGKGNVNLCFFSKNNLINKDIINDFLQKNSLEVENDTSILKNESLSLEELAINYLKNKKLLELPEDKTQYRFKTKTNFHISKELLSPIIEKNMEDILWMENRLGQKIYDKDNYIDTLYSIKSEDDLLKIGYKVLEDFSN